MYMALYRKWRPEVFDTMSGQAHIIRILKNQLTSGQISHAYLFCGTRGTGKTTTARILAKGVNCLAEQGNRPCGVCEHCVEVQNGAFMDVIEIDAASNNGVENIRELRESVKYPPAKGRYKVYIVDEVHMLSSGAFNALLKTLEEPPEHVIFILATTEIHKLPATILSRCLRLDFRRLSEQDITDKLREICAHTGAEAEDSALSLIAANADGAMRDALSMLDQCFSAAPDRITRRGVVDILGTAGEEIFIELTERLLVKDAPEALMVIDRMAADGKDIRQLLKDWIRHFRNLMMAKYADKLENIINLSCENIDRIKAQSAECTMEFINAAITMLAKTSEEAKWSAQPRILLELAVVRLSDLRDEISLDALAARVAELEQRPAAQSREPMPRQKEAVWMQDGGQSAGEEWESLSSINAELRQQPAAAVKAKSKTEKAAKSKNRELPIGDLKNGLTDNSNAGPIGDLTDGLTGDLIKGSQGNSNAGLIGGLFEEPPGIRAAAPESNLPAASAPEPPADLDKLWKEVFRQGTAKKITFNMLAKGVRIASMNDQTVTLEAETPPKVTSVEQNASLIADILLGITGKKRKVDCALAGKAARRDQAGEELISKLGGMIGADKLIIED